MEDTIAWVAKDVFNLQGCSVVPFYADFFGDSLIALFAKHPGKLWPFILDFTHDNCLQKYKLGGIVFAGMHYEDADWSNTTVPGHVCLANEEGSFSYVPTIQSMKHFFRSKYNIEIED